MEDEDDAPSVAIDLTEVTFRIEADGSMTRTTREVYRLRSAEPGEAWSHVWSFWRPWGDEPPTIDATVVAPDGTAQKLDQKTVSDQADKTDNGVLTDSKLRIAPLPALALGSVVDRTTTVRRKPLFVKGASLELSFEPRAPEKKRVYVVDVPAGAPLHLETFDLELTPTRTEANGRVVLRYERGPASPQKRGELGAPLGSVREPTVRISTVADWQAAASAWAEKVDPQYDVAAVKSLAQALVAGQTTRDGKVRALLAWLRGTVRYTGLELDEAAWVPRRSSEVLERKYGDCKDLSVLLTAMLRAVGVDADAALLFAGYSRDVTPGFPGLTHFNHAIVRVGSGPALWIDPTAPFTALGELPPAVTGRQALIARADTTALTPVVATGTSRLDTRIDWFFAPSGPVRTVRKRTSEGWLFREGREVAANSKELYRKNLESWAQEKHEAKGTIKVDSSDAVAAGDFREELEIADSHWGSTEADQAAAPLSHDQAFSAVRYLTSLEDELDSRKEPFEFINGSRSRVVNVYHPPVGYRLKELPPNVKESLGLLNVSLTWQRGTGDDVEATLEFDFKGGVITVDQAKTFVKEVFPKLDLQVSFSNSVLSAINDGRYHAAAMEAEALLAKHPTATWRSMLAYALSAAGLQADAELEARKALAEAPKDPLVRNRLAFVLLHNDQGLDFGRGYKRDELLKLLEETRAIAPDNEWARRMHVLVLFYEPNGTIASDPGVLKQLEAELAEYRDLTKDTRITELDDEAIDVMLRQRAWDRLIKALPDFPQTDLRDGAWLAAELVTRGPESAFARANQDRRLSEKASGLAMQYVMLGREYETLQKLFAFQERMQQQERQGQAQNEAARNALASLKRTPAPPAGTVESVWTRISTMFITGAPQSELKQVIGGEFSEADARVARLMMGAAMDKFPRGGADPAGFTQDFTLTLSTFDRRPLPGFGELVTLRMKLRGMGAPTTMLMEKGPKGYQARFDLGPKIAAKSIELLQSDKPAEAKELLRALIQITPDAPRPLKEERADLDDAGYAWAALYAVNHANPPPHVAKWLEAQVLRPDSSTLAFELSVQALAKAWQESPEKKVALGKKLEGSTLPGRRESAFLLTMSGLRDSGKYKEALAHVDKQLVSNPRDLRFLEYKSDVLPQLGMFEQSRALNRQLASEVEPSRAAGYLNDAAWWALFGTVDDEAVQEIQRSREISASAAYVNTAACVYAAAKKYDSAAQEILRMVRSASEAKEDDLDSSYWYARGLMAEGFGRLDTARGFYKRVKKEKVSSPSDVWHLAQKRLQVLR